jgi:hypothetical protein
MNRTTPKLWPTELLEDHLGTLKPRIFLIAYEAKFLERAHYIFNLPDMDIDEFADKISR